ncbi:MAG: hypothetical protein WCY30_00510 [Candidatus Neomarinimicrobiota bacterium]|jgi:hypothetical protein
MINVVGRDFGQSEHEWSPGYFPAVYNDTWAPGGNTGFFLGHKPIAYTSEAVWVANHAYSAGNKVYVEQYSIKATFECLVAHTSSPETKPWEGSLWKDYWTAFKESYLSIRVGDIGGFTITDHYLYNLASGTPSSSPKDGIVLRAHEMEDEVRFDVYDALGYLRVSIGKVIQNYDSYFGLIVNDATGTEIFSATDFATRIGGASGWEFTKDGYIIGVGGTIQTRATGSSPTNKRIVIGGVDNALKFYRQGYDYPTVVIDDEIYTVYTYKYSGIKVLGGVISSIDADDVLFEFGIPASGSHLRRINFDAYIKFDGPSGITNRYDELYSSVLVWESSLNNRPDSLVTSITSRVINDHEYISVIGIDSISEITDSESTSYVIGIKSVCNNEGSGYTYGIYASATGSGVVWAGYFNDGDVLIKNYLRVGGLADNTTPAFGVKFGLSEDTNLYRKAADLLMTDDSFLVDDYLIAKCIASSTLRNSHDAEVNSYADSYTKLKTITFSKGFRGQLRCTWQMKVLVSGTGYAKLYKNGVAIADTENTTTNTSYETKTENITLDFDPGDTLELYVYTTDSPVYIKELRLSYDYNSAVPTSNS